MCAIGIMYLDLTARYGRNRGAAKVKGENAKERLGGKRKDLRKCFVVLEVLSGSVLILFVDGLLCRAVAFSED